MNLTDEIHFYADPDIISIWWDKPEGADLIDSYEIRLDGQVCGVTRKTHFTFEDMESDREYTVQVTAKNAEGLLMDDVALRIHTPKPKTCIDVTLEPYCAVGDSVTKNTGALQYAIDDCPPGGSVIIPEGTYLTGALFLHSDMELNISEGAVLLGSSDASDYLPLIKGRVDGTEQECFAGLINIGCLNNKEGPSCRNIVIRGKGTVKGGGMALAADEKKDGHSSAALINISNSSDVRISYLTLADALSCSVHMTYSLNVLTDHCVFRSGEVSESDGWIPDSSENCTIFACTFFTGGESISIKSGKNPEGNVIGRPCRKIRIFDCKSMFGEGLSIGSEMSGGVENVKIWDCDLERSACGIHITAERQRGGYVRGILIEDCTTSRLRVLPADPDTDGRAGSGVPDLGNILCDRLIVTGRCLKNGEWRECRAVEMEGFGKSRPLQNILLKGLDIRGGLGVYTEYCEKLIFESEGDKN